MNDGQSNRRLHLDVFLSDCTLENEPDLLRSTLKAGFIARALAIYKVNRVVIYKGKRDYSCRLHGKRLEALLRYSVIPPYLKKRLVPKSPTLRYAGMIPPLQIDTHLATDPPQEGEIRLGYIEGMEGDRLTLYIGLKKTVKVSPKTKPVRFMERLIPVVNARGDWIVPEEGSYYLGFEVAYAEHEDILSLMRKYAGLRIGTSRHGEHVSRLADKLRRDCMDRGRVALVFGEPYRGLREMLEELGGEVEEAFDYYLNFIPGQGTKTVRVEEALIAVLQTVRLMLSVE